MNTQIERGRRQLWLLLGAVCLLFLVNVFYPIFLNSSDSSERMTTFSVMAIFVVFACGGKCWARVSLGAVSLFIALINLLVLFVALSSGRFFVTLAIGVTSLAFSVIGWMLLTSESIRAFETARQPNA